jgi:predicted membrane-bound dolichyl-phosphate-mannose-protein mannosyltransferase
MEAAAFFEKLVLFYQTTRRHIPDSSNLGVHLRVKLSAGTAMDIRMMSNCQRLKESFCVMLILKRVKFSQ